MYNTRKPGDLVIKMTSFGKTTELTLPDEVDCMTVIEKFLKMLEIHGYSGASEYLDIENEMITSRPQE